MGYAKPLQWLKQEQSRISVGSLPGNGAHPIDDDYTPIAYGCDCYDTDIDTDTDTDTYTMTDTDIWNVEFHAKGG